MCYSVAQLTVPRIPSHASSSIHAKISTLTLFNLSLDLYSFCFMRRNPYILHLGF